VNCAVVAKVVIPDFFTAHSQDGATRSTPMGTIFEEYFYHLLRSYSSFELHISVLFQK